MKALEIWEQFETRDIIEILRVLTDIKYDSASQALLQMISQWLALNIHKVKIEWWWLFINYKAKEASGNGID